MLRASKGVAPRGRGADPEPPEPSLADEPSPPAPQRGRKEITQERILTAAMELFLRRGFDATSIAHIARVAGVSRGAIFWHFSDKETLFRAACERFVVPFRDQLRGMLCFLPPRKRVFELFAAYESFVDRNADSIRAFVRWVLDSPVHARALREHLLALHEEFRGELRGAFAELVDDPKEAAALADGFVSLMDGNLLLKLFGDGRVDDERLRTGLGTLAKRVLGEAAPGEPIPGDAVVGAAAPGEPVPEEAEEG